MSRAALAAHRAAIFVVACLALTAFGCNEPWSRPLLGIAVGALSVSVFLRMPEDSFPWRLVAPVLVALLLGSLAACFRWNAAGPSALGPVTASFERTREALCQLAMLLLALLCSRRLFIGPGGLRAASTGLLSAAGYLTFLAVLQRAGGNTLLLGVRSYAHGVPFGPIVNYNHAADVLILALPIALIRGGEAPRERISPVDHWARRFVTASPFAMLLAGLVVTSSRGAGLSLAVVLVVWAVVSMRGARRWALMSAAFLIPVFILWRNEVFNPARAGFMDDSTLIRLALWKGALKVIADHPLFGAGPGGVWTVFDPYRPAWISYMVDRVHSEPLELVVEYGVLGAAAIAAAAVFSVSSFIACWRRADAASHRAAAPVLAGLSAVLLHQAVEFSLRVPAVAFLVAIAGGALWAAVEEPRLQESHGGVRRGLAFAAFLTAVLAAEGIPTAVAGAFEAVHHYDVGADRRVALERALAFRGDAELHRQAVEPFLAGRSRAGAEEALRQADLALLIEPGDIRQRRLAGRSLAALGRPGDAAFMGWTP